MPATGGAIASFRWRGHDVMRPTSPPAYEHGDVRQFASFPLVPYSNRVDHARLATDAGTHQLARNFGDHPHAIHGVGWQRAWAVESREPSSARIIFDHQADAATSMSWPFAFRATQTFVVTASQGAAMLTTTLSIRNTGRITFPYGLGWHPYFARDASTVLGFGAKGMWSTDSTCIPTEHRAIANGHGFDPARAIADTTLDNVFTG